MHRPTLVLLTLASLLPLSAERSAAQALPSVPGFTVTEYVPPTVALGPRRMSFDRATGALYLGRDDVKTSGTNGASITIRKVGPGGSPVAAYGNSTTTDPDAVFFDAVGTASEGAPGSVIIGGVQGTQGRLAAIRPDGTVQTIDGPSSTYDNPSDFAVDGTGRALMVDFRENGSGEIRIVTGSGTPALLFTVAGVNIAFVAVDAQDRIFVSKIDGTVGQYASDGTLLDASYASGLGINGGAIAIGPGGGFGTSLYAIDEDDGSLVRIDGPGQRTTIGTGFSDAVGDLEFGPDGALYAADFTNDRILRIEPAAPADWSASSGHTPDDVCPAWTLTDTADPENPVLAGGHLTISTDVVTENISYLQSGQEISMPELLVIDARLRFVSGFSAGPTRAPGFIGFTTSPNVGALFFVDTDEIFLTTTGDTVGANAVVDTDDAAHTYRIVVEGTASGSPVKVFYDGVLTLTGATYTDAPNFAAVERIFWGEASIGTFGTLEWEFFRHNASICTTTTTTTSSSSSSTSTSNTTATSTSTSTSSSTSSTTVPPGGCNGIPDGPTFASILCRATVLRTRVLAETGLGRFQEKLAANLQKGGEKGALARQACAVPSLRTVKKRLKQAEKSFAQYRSRLRSRSAGKQIDAPLRAGFLADGEALRNDARTLRGRFQCPADAT